VCVFSAVNGGQMQMAGQRGAFMRGRGTPNQRGRGRMSQPYNRNMRSFSRSRSRSYSRWVCSFRIIGFI